MMQLCIPGNYSSLCAPAVPFTLLRDGTQSNRGSLASSGPILDTRHNSTYSREQSAHVGKSCAENPALAGLHLLVPVLYLFFSCNLLYSRLVRSCMLPIV